MSRSMCLAALVGLSPFLSVPTAFGQAASFDGNWSVEVVTERGDCDKVYRYPVAIQAGRIRYAGPEAFNASGTVTTQGRITGSISRGDLGASVSGRLSGGSGSGTWRTTGSRSCSGRWDAEKRG